MARTYEIACHDCKHKLWIGQGRQTGGKYLYKTPEALLKLESFLFSHQQHRIEFGDDERLALDDYKDLDPE